MYRGRIVVAFELRKYAFRRLPGIRVCSLRCLEELASYAPNLMADSGITLTTFKPFPIQLAFILWSSQQHTSIEAAHATSAPELLHCR